MPGIFNDERRGTGPIPVNPTFAINTGGTARESSPDVVAERLTWGTRPRIPLLAGDDPRAAGTTTLYEYAT